MKSTTRRARITQLDARQVAFAAATHVLEAYRREIRELFGAPFRMSADDGAALQDAAVRKTPTYRLLRAIAEYGVSDGELKLDLEQAFEQLLPALRKLHSAGHLAAPTREHLKAKAFAADLEDLLAELDTIAFDTDLGAILAAAWARTQLQRDKPVTATQLAVLAGLSNIAIGNAIRAGALKAKQPFRDKARRRGNPYLITPDDARSFLRQREATGLPTA